MRLLIVSEMNLRRGSGYTTLALGLAEELERRRHDLMIVAFDYDGSEHDLRAPIVPTDQKRIPHQMAHIRAGFRPDATIVIFDLSLHHIVSWLQTGETPYVGIFPVESDPIIHPTEWTNTIDTMHVALCESRFGTKLLNDLGIAANYWPVGIDPFWRLPTAEERGEARSTRNIADRFVVLSVCDNHERKNLPAHYATIAMLSGQEVQWPPLIGKQRRIRRPVRTAYYIVNTKRRANYIGYNNWFLTERFGVSDRCLVLEHGPNEGLSREEVRELYWASDALLILSKAEGFGLPVLEAMACGLPVVGTDCTGIAENLADGRGILIPPEYVHIDPFQNQDRRWADPQKAAEALADVCNKGARAQAEKARAYVETLTWTKAAVALEEAIHSVQAPA